MFVCGKNNRGSSYTPECVYPPEPLCPPASWPADTVLEGVRTLGVGLGIQSWPEDGATSKTREICQSQQKKGVPTSCCTSCRHVLGAWRRLGSRASDQLGSLQERRLRWPPQKGKKEDKRLSRCLEFHSISLCTPISNWIISSTAAFAGSGPENWSWVVIWSSMLDTSIKRHRCCDLMVYSVFGSKAMTPLAI